MAKTLVALIASLCIAFSAVAAQSETKAKKPAKPGWTELTSAQQQVLAPLQPEWEQLDTTRRKKWVSIADRYPTMKQAEQQRLQKRNEVRQKWQEYQQSVAPAATTPTPTVETPTGPN